MNVFSAHNLYISILVLFLGILSGCTLDLKFYEFEQLPSLSTPGVYSSQASRSLYPNSRRVRNTATTLADGRILVVGGTYQNAPNPALASVEVFNTLTSRWSNGPQLTESRSHHTATLLANGKVLVVGGRSDLTFRATAELYDSNTNSWSSANSMSVARASHTATLLQDGRVLVAGGQTGNVTYTASLEIYDPATNSWSAAGSLPVARARHAAVLFPNGKVLIVGGSNPGLLSDTETIIPNTPPALPSFEAIKTNIGAGRNDLTATLLKDGRAVVIGGLGAISPSAAVGIIDPANPGALIPATSLTTARFGHTATLVNGILVVTGGFSDAAGSTALNDSLIYTPDGSLGSWSSLGTLKNGVRGLHTANISGDYLILLNGITGTTSPVTMAEKIDMSKFTWRRQGNLAKDRALHVTALLPNGKVLVAGGLSQTSSTNTPLDSTEIFDPATGLWSAGPALPSPRLFSHATVLTDGRVLVAGGLDGAFARTATTAIYNPASNSWSAGPSIAVPRVGHSSHLLPNGKVIIIGGAAHPTTSAPTEKTEIFDPATNQWTYGPDMPTAVSEFSSATLSDNTILILGGLTTAATTSITTVQAYNPSTNSFTTKTPMTLGRYQAAAAVLPSGNVLLTGGWASTGSMTATTEIYNVSANTWSAGPSLSANRRAHGAISLPSGKILVTSGVTNLTFPSIAAKTSEIYNPATNSWSVDPIAIEAGHTLGTLLKLPDGRILIAGGGDPDYTGAVTETYIEGQLSGIAWIGSTPLLGGRVGSTTTLMKNGKILFTGGQPLAEAAALTESTALYDTSTNTMTAGPNMANDRTYHTATLLPSGKVFIAGGMSFTLGGASATAEIYDPTANTVTPVALPLGRYFHSALVMPDGKLLITGGIDSSGTPALQNDVYDPATGNWSTLAPRPAPSALDTAITISETEIIFIGAFGNSKYDFSTGNWSTLSNPSFARMNSVVVKLPSGKIFVTGGTDLTTNNALAISEVYNPADDTWSTAANLDKTLTNISGQLLPSGKVAITGGNENTSANESESGVRLYDPATDQWSFGTPLSEARSYHSTILMPDGAMVVFSGASATFGMLPFWETIGE
ncbi:Kelch repeat-containing protein [Bdellovibrio sp. HCB290]|uniref:Kelch repeat-containing protein n=1 Tax=Bdellovibrio sp. HCB290 TaxID=3394356 RepID=UPI0039B635E7